MIERTASPIDPDWIEAFEASLRRPLRLRLDCSFIRTPRPVMEDAPYRCFETMEEYRRWCRENLPSYLGYS
jgi:hypothetical protein